jgi:hypothetical protein
VAAKLSLIARVRDRERTPGIVLSTALALLVLPPLIQVLANPRQLFARVAPDTFYYLVVGRNAGLHASISFDGEHASNGFHPLWQAFVSLLYAFRLPGTGTHWDLFYLVATGLVLLALSLICLSGLFRRPDGSLNPLFVLMPVGAYALLVCAAWLAVPLQQIAAENYWEGGDAVYGTMWRDANGMESAAVVAAYCWLLHACVFWDWEHDSARAAKLGGLLALLGFARLDHWCFSILIWAWLTLRAVRSEASGARRRWFAMTVTFVAAVAVYLFVNELIFGSAVPVSGRLKSSWPMPTASNARALFELVGWIFGRARPPFFLIWRALQSALPALIALLSPLALLDVKTSGGALLVSWAGPRPRLSQSLAVTALGVLVLHGYDFFFVRIEHQGNWYYPVSILFVSVLALQAAERVRPWVRERFGITGVRSHLVELSLCGALALLVLAFYLRFDHIPGYHDAFANFYFEEAPRVRATFAANPPRLLELDDGIVAYATGFQAMSATGSGLDLEGARAFEQGTLVQLALSRGFDHVTSVVYLDFAALGRGPSPQALRMFMLRSDVNLSKAAQLPLQLAYRAEHGRFGIVKVN